MKRLIKKISFYGFVFLVLLLFLGTFTMLLLPRPQKDILTRVYTKHPDLSLKKEGNKKLVVALHGMYANPEVFREFGEKILVEGWDLYAPALPNAAYSQEDLIQQKVYQWKDSLRVAHFKITNSAQDYEEIVLLGHSQGGALALALAPKLSVLRALAVVATPLHLSSSHTSWHRRVIIRMAGLLYFVLPNKGIELAPYPKDVLQKYEDVRGGGRYLYMLTVHSLNIGLRQSRQALKKIRIPVFVAYEKNDKTVSFDNFTYLTNKLHNTDVTSLVTDTTNGAPLSTHHRLFSYLYTKDQLVESLTEFLRGLP